MKCPVLECEWELDTTPPDTAPGALADVFGWGVVALHHRNTVATNNERKAEAHLQSHTVIEWMNTVNALREALAGQIAMTIEVSNAFQGITS
jgi:hypothetical protein